MSGLDKETIQSRHDQLTQDINKLQDMITDLDKRRTETIAQLNAFQGAKQQCQMFLREINNENSGEQSLTENTGDMGSLGGPPPTAE